MNISNLTPQQLRNAADLKEKIDGLQNELNELLGGEVSVPAQTTIEAPEKPANGRRSKKRKKLSAEGRANIAAAQRARWAARRGEAPATEAERPARQPKKTKKQVIEARLNALAKAREARWAKVRAAKGTAVQSQEGPATEAEKPKKKRTISEAGRRAMSLAGKRRWAKARRAARLGM
jgi:hypothetical protein